MIEIIVAVHELELAKTNLTRKHRLTIKKLKYNFNIIIKKAYIGSTVVIINCDDYISERIKQLTDTNFYTKTDTDYTELHNYVGQLNVQQMLKDREIVSNDR